MTKDEMKNRISMALKDPILQHGFEIICKELETEKKLNAEIKVRFVKCNTCSDDMKSKCLMFSENLCQGERCEELIDLMSLINKSDLEKENAELKKQQFSLRNERNTFLAQNEQYEKDLIDFNENLTTAKEIIKKLKALYFSPVVTKDDVKQQDEILEEVEQFLKETE